MKSKLFSLVILSLAAAPLAYAGSAIGVTGQSPLVCKTTLIRSGQLREVETILSSKRLTVHNGAFPNGSSCSTSLALSGDTLFFGNYIQCGHDQQTAVTLYPLTVTETPRTTILSWSDATTDYSIELGNLSGWPALPRHLSEVVRGVVASDGQPPFVEIQPAQCSVPPGF